MITHTIDSYCIPSQNNTKSTPWLPILLIHIVSQVRTTQSQPHDYPYYWFKLYPKSEQHKVNPMITHTIDSYCIPSQNNTKSPMITHTIDSYCIPSQNNTKSTPWLPILLIHIVSQVRTTQSQSYKLKKMTKIQVLLKIQSGHDSIHRQTDTPVYPTINFVEVGGKIIFSTHN